MSSMIRTSIPLAAGAVSSAATPAANDARAASSQAASTNQVQQAVASGVNTAAVVVNIGNNSEQRAASYREGRHVDASFRGERGREGKAEGKEQKPGEKVSVRVVA